MGYTSLTLLYNCHDSLCQYSKGESIIYNEIMHDFNYSSIILFLAMFIVTMLLLVKDIVVIQNHQLIQFPLGLINGYSYEKEYAEGI